MPELFWLLDVESVFEDSGRVNWRLAHTTIIRYYTIDLGEAVRNQVRAITILAGGKEMLTEIFPNFWTRVDRIETLFPVEGNVTVVWQSGFVKEFPHNDPGTKVKEIEDLMSKKREELVSTYELDRAMFATQVLEATKSMLPPGT